MCSGEERREMGKLCVGKEAVGIQDQSDYKILRCKILIVTDATN